MLIIIHLKMRYSFSSIHFQSSSGVIICSSIITSLCISLFFPFTRIPRLASLLLTRQLQMPKSLLFLGKKRFDQQSISIGFMKPIIRSFGLTKPRRSLLESYSCPSAFFMVKAVACFVSYWYSASSKFRNDHVAPELQTCTLWFRDVVSLPQDKKILNIKS